MTAFSDLEQSKKLAEILPLESADMYYHKNTKGEIVDYPHFNAEYKSMVDRDINYNDNVLPCWSLAALLSVLPKYIGGSVLRMDMSEDDFYLWFDDFSGIVDEILPGITKDNPIDACVEMILKLHEQKLL